MDSEFKHLEENVDFKNRLDNPGRSHKIQKKPVPPYDNKRMIYHARMDFPKSPAQPSCSFLQSRKIAQSAVTLRLRITTLREVPKFGEPIRTSQKSNMSNGYRGRVLINACENLVDELIEVFVLKVGTDVNGGGALRTSNCSKLFRRLSASIEICTSHCPSILNNLFLFSW